MSVAPINGTLAFCGGGNMARSLIGGLVRRGHSPTAIVVHEPADAAAVGLRRDFPGLTLAESNRAAVERATLVVLAVKPQVMRAVCAEIAPALPTPGPTLLSIAAGIRLAQLERWLGSGRALVRAMPNTPALIGAGVSALAANATADAAARRVAGAVLAAAGEVVWLDDDAAMDAVTAVSGSGPAYLFLLIEAMQAAARAQGLAPDVARTLVLHTALGAARMAIEGGEDASVLRQRVTSPGGTTAAALAVFESGGFRTLVEAAIARATARGRELAADHD